MAGKKTGYKRAFSPRRDYAENMAREDVSEKFGEEFRYYDTLGIGRAVELAKRYNIIGRKVTDYFNKRYSYHYRKYKR